MDRPNGKPGKGRLWAALALFSALALFARYRPWRLISRGSTSETSAACLLLAENSLAPPSLEAPQPGGDFIKKIRNHLNIYSPTDLSLVQELLQYFISQPTNRSLHGLSDDIFSLIDSILNKTIPAQEIVTQFPFESSDLRQEMLGVDSTQSPWANRRTFPLLSQRCAITHSRLAILQFSYLVSGAMRHLALRYGSQMPENAQRQFNTYFTFLIDDIVNPYWADLPAWHWARPFRNIHERTLARLDPAQHPELSKKSYFTAFFDEDFFLMAMAADLLFVWDRVGTRLPTTLYPQRSRERLLFIRHLTFQAMNRSVEFRQGGFSFQPGLWKDHPDYQHAGCLLSAYPQSPCPKADVTEDISHFQRAPFWWRSFRDSWPARTREHRFYQEALTRFASHFADRLVRFTEKGEPQLVNYVDGSNGWYRVAYHSTHPRFGYAPGGLTLSLAHGAYYTLGEFDSRMNDVTRKTCRYLMALSNETPNSFDEAFKTSYSHFLEKTGLYKDRFSLYARYCARAISQAPSSKTPE